MSRKNKRASRRTHRRKCRLCRDEFSIHPHTSHRSQHVCQNCVDVEEAARLLRAEDKVRWPVSPFIRMHNVAIKGVVSV